MVAWIINAAGALLLLLAKSSFDNNKRDVVTLQGNYQTLQIQHAALSAKVAAERDDTLRSLSRIEGALRTINHKLDDLRDSNGRSCDEEDRP